MNNNDNKNFFDYDSYIKSNGKKKRRKKGASAQQETALKKKAPLNAPKPEAAKAAVNEKAEKLKAESKDSIESIKRMFDDALGEQAEEMAEFAPEEPEPEPPVQNDGRAKKQIIYASRNCCKPACGCGTFFDYKLFY